MRKLCGKYAETLVHPHPDITVLPVVRSFRDLIWPIWNLWGIYAKLCSDFVQTCIPGSIGDDLRAVTVADTVACSGVNVFDKDDYERTMQADGAYECMLPLTGFSFKNFTHEANVPTVGTVARAVKSLLPIASNCMASNWQTMAIPITVSSALVAPVLEDLMPSALDEIRIAMYVPNQMYDGIWRPPMYDGAPPRFCKTRARSLA